MRIGSQTTTARDGAVAVWDLRSGKMERELLSRGKQPACPQEPLRIGFSRTGKRLFAASGLIVHFPSKHVSGIDPKLVTVIGAASAGLVGVVAMNVVNNNVDVIAERSANARSATLQAKLNRGTALRVWAVETGRLVADFADVFEHQPTGVADAFFYPWGSAAVTLGETPADAWDLSAGNRLGRLHQVVDADEVRRARAAADGPGAPLVRRVDFTYDGQHALVLVCGERNIRMVPWPAAGEGEFAPGP